ncbi:MAG TPA: hypothetical protein VMM78_16370 [Thermomicrobiales bacterium]|nr:hypothetical protein [Thermomicrobiales bacterium]
MNWINRHFALGIVVTALAIVLALTLGALMDTAWQSLALMLLALGALIILVLLTRPGVYPAGVGAGYDFRSAMIELMGRETSGTATEYRAGRGSVAAFTNLIPPLTAVIVLLASP